MASLYAVLTVLYGVFNTISIHLSKAMQDHGIRLFKKERERVIKLGQNYCFKDDVKELFTKESKQYLWVYIVGVLLNQSPILWGTLGGRFGRAPYFTSVFPLGMVLLLIYSKKVMHDKIPKMELYGISAIFTGTIILGIENIFQEPASNELNYSLAWVIIAIFMVIAFLAIYFSIKTKAPNFIGIIFGSLGGIMGSLDPILKDIGQEFGEGGVSAYIPGNVFGWTIFFISFIMGSFSFLITQWGYALGAKAPLMTGFYNTFYLSFPVFLYLLIDSSYNLSVLTLLGFFFNIVGIVILSNHVVAIYKERKIKLAKIPIECPDF